jgi:hypothetical protein
MVCVFMASKMEDVLPLELDCVYDNIGHKQFSNKYIIRKEKKIASTLKYNLIQTTPYEFIKIILAKIIVDLMKSSSNVKLTHML